MGVAKFIILTFFCSFLFYNGVQANESFEKFVLEMPSPVQKPTLWKKFMSSFGLSGAVSCPEKWSQDLGGSSSQLMDRGESHLRQGVEEGKKKKYFCRSARFFQEIQKHQKSIDSKVDPKVEIRIIESFHLASDHTGTINKANIFIKAFPEDKDVPYVHYLLLRSVFAQVLSSGLDQEWAEYALGVHPKQNPHNPFFLKMAMKSFLLDNPNSEYITSIEWMLKEVRSVHAETKLKLGRYYFKKKKYKAAILNLSPIVKGGPSIPAFAEAVGLLSKSFGEFSRKTKENKISDQELRDFLQLDSGDEVPRELLVKKMEANGRNLLSMMEKNIPDDQWTKKTAKYWSNF